MRSTTMDEKASGSTCKGIRTIASPKCTTTMVGKAHGITTGIYKAMSSKTWGAKAWDPQPLMAKPKEAQPKVVD